MKQKTFADTYEANQPLRLAACKEYYNTPPRKKFATIEAARATKGKFGNWICLVKMDEGTEFYTTHNFREKWVAAGWVLGMWNELTLIEKTSKKSKKVILELYMEIWHCYEDGKGMAYSLFTTTELQEAEAICREKKYEIVQMIDLELQDLED